VSNAKWQSWKQLGDMASMEAMRLFVRTLEEEQPGWWTPDVAAMWEAQRSEKEAQAQANGASQESAATADDVAAAGPAPSKAAVKSRSVAEVVVEGSWVSPFIASDHRPPPRYEQALALVGNQLYVIGGNCGGRYLGDTWALNLENLAWTCISGSRKAAAKAAQQGDSGEAAPLLDAPALPPVAGHAAVSWNGNVLSFGGHSKVRDAAAELPVHLLDTGAGAWSLLQPTVAPGSGAAPRPRGGHSATLIGSKVYVFGGEDAKRKPLGELWTLDLATLEWDEPEVSGDAPLPRSAHSAVAYRNRHILYFGGGSVASCFNDLAVLDTQTMEWSVPETEGPVPPPRAGHAAAILGSVLYIVGGGNNSRGCADMYALDLSTLGTAPLQWTLVGNTPVESAIASEGLSLLSVPMAGCMVSFGGYNGRYHNAVHVYRPEGYVVLKPGQHAGPAAAQAAAPGAGRAAAAAAAAPHAETNGGSVSAAAAASQGESASRASSLADFESARREAAAAKEAVALELSIMRRQLDSATAALAAAERSAEEAKEALAAEQQKTMQLEVEVAELRQKLVVMADLERELARHRQVAADAAGKKTGLWGYITGSDAAGGQ